MNRPTAITLAAVFLAALLLLALVVMGGLDVGPDTDPVDVSPVATESDESPVRTRRTAPSATEVGETVDTTPPESEPASTIEVALSGVVLESGAPIDHAAVVEVRAESGAEPQLVHVADGARGRFEGTVTVASSADVLECRAVVASSNRASAWSQHAVAELARGAFVALRLRATVGVTGTVVDPEGRPIPGARVVALVEGVQRSPGYAFADTNDDEHHLVTDEQGAFAFRARRARGQIDVAAVTADGVVGAVRTVELDERDEVDVGTLVRPDARFATWEVEVGRADGAPVGDVRFRLGIEDGWVKKLHPGFDADSHSLAPDADGVLRVRVATRPEPLIVACGSRRLATRVLVLDCSEPRARRARLVLAERPGVVVRLTGPGASRLAAHGLEVDLVPSDPTARPRLELVGWDPLLGAERAYTVREKSVDPGTMLERRAHRAIVEPIDDLTFDLRSSILDAGRVVVLADEHVVVSAPVEFPAAGTTEIEVRVPEGRFVEFRCDDLRSELSGHETTPWLWRYTAHVAGAGGGRSDDGPTVRGDAGLLSTFLSEDGVSGSVTTTWVPSHVQAVTIGFVDELARWRGDRDAVLVESGGRRTIPLEFEGGVAVVTVPPPDRTDVSPVRCRLALAEPERSIMLSVRPVRPTERARTPTLPSASVFTDEGGTAEIFLLPGRYRVTSYGRSGGRRSCTIDVASGERIAEFAVPYQASRR